MGCPGQGFETKPARGFFYKYKLISDPSFSYCGKIPLFQILENGEELELHRTKKGRAQTFEFRTLRKTSDRRIHVE